MLLAQTSDPLSLRRISNELKYTFTVPFRQHININANFNDGAQVNFRVYKTAELAIMRLSYLSQIISNNELLSYLQDIAKQERIFYNSIEWHRDNQRTKSINHSIMDTHA